MPYWGKNIVTAIPQNAITQINKVLGPRFVTKWGAKQGVLVLGKQVPLMLGAVVGAAGNSLFGRAVVQAIREILGPAADVWPDQH